MREWRDMKKFLLALVAVFSLVAFVPTTAGAVPYNYQFDFGQSIAWHDGNNLRLYTLKQYNWGGCVRVTAYTSSWALIRSYSTSGNGVNGMSDAGVGSTGIVRHEQRVVAGVNKYNVYGVTVYGNGSRSYYSSTSSTC